MQQNNEFAQKKVRSEWRFIEEGGGCGITLVHIACTHGFQSIVAVILVKQLSAGERLWRIMFESPDV